ncbi:MAG TPA: AI-2E family transporter, partial [Tepidisphaeraceae bacterium]
DARDVATATKNWLAAGPPAPPEWLGKVPFVGETAAEYWKELADDARELAQRMEHEEATEEAAATTTAAAATTVPATSPATGESKLVRILLAVMNWAKSWLLVAGLAIGQGVLEVALSVLLTFFLFRDGAALGARLESASMLLAGEQGRHLLQLAGATIRGVVYGILGTALVQGVLAGLGFAVAGVPGAALLGLLTFLLSAVPVGPPLIWFPATLWLFHQGSNGWAIFMLVWGFIVSSVDNVVKPWIISQGSDMPFVLILFGVLGGAMAFGVIGVFLGPTLLAVAYRMIDEWSSSTPESADRAA